MAAESPGGPSLLVIAVIGKSGGIGKRGFFPVNFPVHGNSKKDEVSPPGIVVGVWGSRIAVLAQDHRDRETGRHWACIFPVTGIREIGVIHGLWGPPRLEN
jgi:hypothetical protein